MKDKEFIWIREYQLFELVGKRGIIFYSKGAYLSTLHSAFSLEPTVC